MNDRLNKTNISSIKELLESNKSKMIKASVAILISFILIFEFKGEIKALDFPHTLKILRNLDNIVIVIIFALGIVAVSFLTLYDLTVKKYFSIRLPFSKIFGIGWISGTINNFIGLGGVVGASLRTFLYEKEGIDTKTAIRFNIYIVLSNITGLSVLILIGFLRFYKFSTIADVNKLYLIILLVFVLYLPVYFLIDKIPILKKKLLGDNEPLPIEFKFRMICASVLDWSVATLFFSGVVMYFSRNLALREIIPVYLISIALGIISFLPGGLGSFDISAFAGLKLIGATSESALAGILIYRLFYYVVPWAFSMLVFLSELIPKKKEKKRQNINLAIEFNTKALAAMVFSAGVILILSAAIPAIVERFKFVNSFISSPILQFSKRISMAIGIMLLILSKGIYEKVKGAYSSTVVLLLLGALLTFIKGLDYEEAIILIVVYVLLFLSRDNFYRETAPIKAKNVLKMILITAIMSFIYAMISYSVVGHFKYILVPGKREVFIEAGLIFLTVWIITGLFLFIRVKRVKFTPPDDEDIKGLEEFLSTNKGNIMTHLLFLKDKYFYYTKDKQMLIPFATIRDKLVVLGEPIGNQDFLEEAITEFRKFADRYAMVPVLYEISDKYFSIYHDYGYDFLKLGEEAIIDLKEFNLIGKKKKDLRLAKNKVVSGELQFEIVSPPFDEKFFEELKVVSDEWLGEKKERGFSLGWFNREYLSRASIAVIRKDSEIIAFANLMPLYDNETMSMDLMRYKKDVPSGTMDAMFILLMEWSKEQGYNYFNLGMAPLSNVGATPYSRNVEKLIGRLFQRGNKIYSFSGLRKYKEKFQPRWESRYLAYPKGLNISILLLQLVMLTSKHNKNIE